MPPRSATPILPLTSIRFFAAAYVVVLHSAAWSGHQQTATWVGRFISSGYTAVGFFFVLSGFILAHVYLDTDRLFDRRAFWLSRFARAYPLLFASLLFDMPNSLIARLSLHRPVSAIGRTLVSFLAECALLQSWDGHFRSINGPSWSLSSEAFFYFVFPFAAFWIWKHRGSRAFRLLFLFWGCALLAPILITFYNPALFHEVDTSTVQWAIELMPIFRIYEFFAGIALCALNRSLVARLTAARLRHFARLALLAACILFCGVIEVKNRIPLLVMSNGALLPVYALLIFGLANIRGSIALIFSNRYLVILGEASYAVYLLHAPLYLYLSRIHPIDAPLMWLIYFAVVVLFSIASFFLLERPARKQILRIASIRPSVTINQEAAAPL